MKTFREKYLVVLILLAVALAATGCVSRNMTLNRDVQELDTSTLSVVLLTFKASNPVNPRYMPEVEEVYINVPGVINSSIGYNVSAPHMTVKERYNEYLISLSKEPGSYLLYKVQGRSFLPMSVAHFLKYFENLEFELEPDSIVYLGHIEMTNRERKEGEPRSGPVLPLIDQSASGYANGTFDVTITDRYDEDIKAFRDQYPVLDGREIKKAVLKQE